MEQPKIETYINGKVVYDNEGQYFFIEDRNDGLKMLAELRGWGAIQNLFKYGTKGQVDMESAAKFQDEIGEYVAEAINKHPALKEENQKLNNQLKTVTKAFNDENDSLREENQKLREDLQKMHDGYDELIEIIQGIISGKLNQDEIESLLSKFQP